MKLYGFSASPNTWKVRALAAHLKQPLDYEFVDLLKGEQRAPSYLALNPTGRTPTLVDGAATLWESNAIMQYIASQTETPLWPNDAKSRADISRWQCWQLAHWDAQACGPLIFENLIKKFANLGTAEQTTVVKATEAFNKEAQVLDRHLAKHKYLANDTLTLADFAVAAPLFLAQGAGMPVALHANLAAWFGRVSSLPCWSETAPQMPAAA